MSDQVDRPDEPKSLAEAVGNVVLRHVHLEHALRQAFMHLAGGPSAPYIAGGQPFSWLLRQIEALHEHRPLTETTRNRVRRAIQEAKAANTLRNRTVHDLWLPAIDGEGFSRIQTQRGQLGMKPTPVTLEQLAEAIAQIERATLMFTMLIFDFLHELEGAPWVDNQAENEYWAEFGL